MTTGPRLIPAIYIAETSLNCINKILLLLLLLL